MRPTPCFRALLIWFLIVAASPVFGAVKLQVRDGRPIVDGVYVNGHGPYRFLVDTGANVNLIDVRLAKAIGMEASFEVELGSAAGKTRVGGSDGNGIALDTVQADRQKFLFSGLEAIHHALPDVQGVLGEWFLTRFDYTLDLQGKRLEFGRQERDGPRSAIKMINARPVIATSLGDLGLDSGEVDLVLFGLESDEGPGYELRTVGGSQRVGKVFGKTLVIQGRKVSSGEVVAIASRPEPGVDGLMPLRLFKAVYVCNSEGYAVFQ